ncbi:MAG: toll/interleukin receptor protein [Proteobacteria bacterium]|nr:toll/interleukin receptor protein [Pseudomonadota bacterium]
MAIVFFSYSHADEEYRDRLDMALTNLKRQGDIESWHDRLIPAGNQLGATIDANLNRADIILLLVSPAFLASPYCHNIEMARALERHEQGEARVIPIIVRPCDWLATPLRNLRATPKDALAITKWPNIDDAYQWITDDLRKTIREMGKAPPASAFAVSPDAVAKASSVRIEPPLRSSNLRVAKQFTQADRDRFLREAFEFMARFFEGSLAALQDRHANIETTFLRVDANKFTGVIYRDGKAASRFKIRVGGSFGGIAYASNDSASDNSMNENFAVEADEAGMFLKAGFGMFGPRDQKLSFEGAAEHFWEKVIEPLQ